MEIVPGVHAVPGIKWSRAYLLVENDQLALIDAGPPMSGSASRVFAYIESIGRRPEELSLLLMTHGHPDHVGGARAIVKRTRALVLTHRSDTHGKRGGRRYVGGSSGMLARLSLVRPAQAHVPIDHGQVTNLLGGIRVLHTPGHTPGSVCFLLEREGLLFSGDTLFSDGERVSRSVPFPGYDRHDYVASLRSLAEMDFAILCGGHGAPLMRGAARRLRELLDVRPDPPTWGGFFASVPRRMRWRRPFTGEWQDRR